MPATFTRSAAPLRSSRPTAVTFLSLAVLSTVCLLTLRGLTLWQQLPTLTTLSTNLPWRYLALTSFTWALLLLPIALGVWRCHPWARIALLIATPIFHLHHWANRLAFAESSYASQNTPLNLLITAASLTIVFAILRHPTIRAQFASSSSLPTSLSKE